MASDFRKIHFSVLTCPSCEVCKFIATYTRAIPQNFNECGVQWVWDFPNIIICCAFLPNQMIPKIFCDYSCKLKSNAILKIVFSLNFFHPFCPKKQYATSLCPVGLENNFDGKSF